MKKALAIGLAAAMAVTMTAPVYASDDSESGKGIAKEDLKIGAIYIGDENEGYTAAHMAGIDEMQEALGLDDSQVIEKTLIGEDEGCYDAAADLADQGCQIIFANSFGHETYILEAAGEYPDVQFCHATGTQAASSGLSNMHNYFTNIYEARYVSGVVAGLKLNQMIEDGTITEEVEIMKYYLKKCWPTVTAASICMVVAYGLQVCTSLVQIQITQGLLDGDLRAFTIRIILLLLTWLAVVLCLIAETFFQGRAVRRMNNALRRDMAAGLLHKTHQEYHKQESGEYLSQFTNDVNQIEQMAWTPFFTIMGSAAQVVFGIVALASIHWLLLVISLVIALVMIFVPRLFSKRLGTVGTACAASQADSVSKIKDLLAGYDVLRFFGKDERFTSGVDAASDSMEQAKYKLTINKDGIGCGLAYVSAVCQVAVVILLGVLILNDMIPLATFMGTGTICAGVYNGLNQVSKLAVSFSASKPYFDKITIHAGEAQLPDFGLPTLQEGITVKDVSFGYDEKKPILVHMNAEFKKGGKYALTGPSGCGKSTLLKILLGWLPGYQGKVLYDERDVRDYTPEQLQQKMSYIEQNVFLFNTTIRENITLGEHFTDEQMEKALRDSALAGDLANMPKGLDTPVGEEGNALSGGQKQRVAIARALIHNRSNLLVDEGTSALDQKNADIVEKSLLSNPDLTLILISHHLSDERKAQFDHVYELTPASSIV